MIYLAMYIYHKNQPNVGKYTSPMDGMSVKKHSICLPFGMSIKQHSGNGSPDHTLGDFCLGGWTDLVGQQQRDMFTSKGEVHIYIYTYT